MSRYTRRYFLEMGTIAAGTLFASGCETTPRIAQTRATRFRKAGEKLNMGFIGVGGRGGNNFREFFDELGEQAVAICDVDMRPLNHLEKHVKAKTGTAPRVYRDYREMLSRENDLDAVVVSTPDHTHAPAAIAAMKQGCHVYVEKPLVRTVWECRRFQEVAKACGVITQMGNHGNGTDHQRRNIEVLQSGILGEISEVHVTTDRPIWPQGVDRPEGEDPIPDYLNWDLFIGTAPMRPHKAGVYHTFKWRGWFDFGTGAMGDIACHGMSFFFRGLDLREVLTVETVKSTPTFKETYPLATTVKIVAVSARQATPVTIYWYDGKTLPDPEKLPAKIIASYGKTVGGTLIIGKNGIFVNDALSLASEDKFRGILQHEATKNMPVTLPRVRSHHWEFAEAIRGGKRPFSDYDHSVPLTELVLLGCISQQVSGELKWDAQKGRFTNSEAANKLLIPHIRPGFEIS